MSVHNQTQMVIKEVEVISINSEKSTPPINNIRLMKNSIDTFQYVINNFSIALFLFLIDHIKIERGTPTIKIEDNWNVIQLENSLIKIKIFFLLTYLNIKPQ